MTRKTFLPLKKNLPLNVDTRPTFNGKAKQNLLVFICFYDLVSLFSFTKVQKMHFQFCARKKYVSDIPVVDWEPVQSVFCNVVVHLCEMRRFKGVV